MELITIVAIIQVFASDYNVDPMTALAVAKVESNFNPSAIGKTHGEIGLFQIRPEYSKLSRKELFNPLLNIKEGLKKLSEAKRGCAHKLNKTWLNCFNAGITGGSRLKDPKNFNYYKKVMAARHQFTTMSLSVR